jgi:hypothetical protein
MIKAATFKMNLLEYAGKQLLAFARFDISA